MAIICPSCGAEIPVADVNVAQGVAVCRACSNVCQLGQLAAAEAAPTAVVSIPRVAKPEGTRIELAELGDRLVVAMPRGMNRGLGLFLLAFGGIWDGISGIILVSLFAGGSGGKGPGSGIDWFALVFISGFFLIGLVVLAFAVYVLTVRIALSIDRTTVTLVRAAFGREWASVRPANEACAVRRVERYKQNEVPKYGVGIDFTGGGTTSIGSALSDPELDWLSGEIAHALRQAGAKIP